MVARYIDIIPPIAIDLVEVNDAPMTIIYPGAVVADSKAGAAKRTSFGLAPSVVAEDGSVGIRIPIVASAEEESIGGAIFCNKLIYKLRKPLVSTSANISGESAPSRFSEISKEIIEGVDYVVPESFIVEERGEAGTRKSEELVKASRKIRFDDSATGKSSQIIKLGVNGEVKVIRF
jgi:L-threonylcarbamoyladenylate synthase